MINERHLVSTTTQDYEGKTCTELPLARSTEDQENSDSAGQVASEPTIIIDPESTSIIDLESTTIIDQESTTIIDPESTTIVDLESTTIIDPESTAIIYPESKTIIDPESTTVIDPKCRIIIDPESTTIILDASFCSVSSEDLHDNTLDISMVEVSSGEAEEISSSSSSRTIDLLDGIDVTLPYAMSEDDLEHSEKMDVGDLLVLTTDLSQTIPLDTETLDFTTDDALIVISENDYNKGRGPRCSSPISYSAVLDDKSSEQEPSAVPKLPTKVDSVLPTTEDRALQLQNGECTNNLGLDSQMFSVCFRATNCRDDVMCDPDPEFMLKALDLRPIKSLDLRPIVVNGPHRELISGDAAATDDT